MRRVERVRAAAVAPGGAGGDEQVGVALEQVEVALAERAQPLGGGAPGPSGGGPEMQRVLELARVLVEQRQREPGAVAEAAVQRAGADAGRAGHVVHRDALDAALVDERRPPPRGCARAVARRVGALARRRAVGDQRELEHGRADHADCSTGAPTSRPGRRAGRPGGRPARGRRARRPSSNAPSAMPTGSSDSSTCAPQALSALRTSACAQTAPNRPVLAPITAAGLSRSTLSGNGPRGPVERVLEPAGERGVVLRRGDQQRVGRPRSRRGSRWTGGRRVVLEVLVEDGQAGEARPTPRARPRAGACRPPPGAACGCGSPGAGCLRCRGSASAYACSTSESSTVSVTSLASALPPDGQRHVPVHVVLGAVDDGLELEVAAGVAERVGGRGDPGAGGLRPGG